MAPLPARPAVITFVIRIWPEWSLSGPYWRGRIEHLPSGRGVAFADLERMLGFIRAMGAFADEPPGGPGAEMGQP